VTPPSGPAQQALAAAAGTAGGALAAAAGVPLGWLLGALGAVALLAVLGLGPKPPPLAREAGQSIVGVGIGLKTTAAALASAAALAPMIALALLYTLLLTTAAALWLAWWAGVDRRTAFYATAAAGVAEMALLAADRGGDPGVVSLVQALRVATIVTLVPALFLVAGVDGGLVAAAEPQPLAIPWLAALAPAAAIAGHAATRWRGLPNPWLLGPLAIGLAAALATGTAYPLPDWLLIAAQVLLGATLGCRFNRGLLERLPRSLAAGLLIALALIVASALGALALSAATALPFPAAMLALAPAGIAEMALTAKVLHLDPLVVTAFHLPRILLILAGIHVIGRLHDRLAARLLPAEPKDKT
jgi:uncharacterized protein